MAIAVATTRPRFIVGKVLGGVEVEIKDIGPAA
jgi:hypothetical protein